VDAAEAAPSFHARFDARAKTYRYRIWHADVLDPFERAYAWHVTGALDVHAMIAAARALEGRHDFAAFQASGGSAKDTEREITRCQVIANGDGWLLIEVTGTGFLRHMVRAIVGSLVEIGRGRHDAGWLAKVLRAGDRTRAGPTAPAHGLFLVGVDYDSRSLAAGS
jgi:tRNA pseudouridine38-40 synthase